MKVVSYTHIGQRDNNEDFLLAEQPLFIVCDGVGGRDKGEVASRFVAENIKGHLSLSRNLHDAIVEANKSLQAEAKTEQSKMGMATTVAACYLTPEVCSIAHVGDSRVYVVRPSEGIYWRTWDHSFVANLLADGHITQAEAETHPKRNHISQALAAKRDGNSIEVDETQISLLKGDRIFICSDGILESYSDSSLSTLLSDITLSIDQILSTIQTRCSTESKDNNTAILIETTLDLGQNGQALHWQPIGQEFFPFVDETIIETESEQPPLPSRLWVLVALIFAALAFVALYLLNN